MFLGSGDAKVNASPCLRCWRLVMASGTQADCDEGLVVELVATLSWWWRAGGTTQPSVVGSAGLRVSGGKQQLHHG